MKKVVFKTLKVKNFLSIGKTPVVVNFTKGLNIITERKYNGYDINYVGNPFEMDFGDSYQRKGYYILDITKSSYEFVESTFTPKHIKIFLSKLCFSF